MSKTAVAYTADIILGRTGEVISRTSQKEAIAKYARENNIEVVAWYEDEAYSEDIMSREGVQRMLAQKGSADCILVERVWCLSRNWPLLRAFIEALKTSDLQLMTATTLWDCVSQMSRNQSKERPVHLRQASATELQTEPYAVRRPKRLNFLEPAPSGSRS